jgi:pimeloyl-ACP methyl ester carboxylesterase
MAGIYRSTSGEAKLHALYAEATGVLGCPLESRYLQTPYGLTHVLVTGAPESPAAVVFHGGNFLNPYSLSWMLPALAGFRVFAPDTVGHPGLSDQRRLSARDDSYGRWASAVLSALDIDRATVIGTSYGGGIALRLSEAAPHRIERLILHVPSAIATAPFARIAAVGVPMLLYRFSPSRERLIRTARPLWGNDPDDLGLRILDAVLRHVRLVVSLPRLTNVKDLSCLKCPVLVIAARQDVLFPADLVLRQAHRLMPSLVKSARLEGSHVPGSADLPQLRSWVREFCDTAAPAR